MSQSVGINSNIKPLRNVAALNEMIERVKRRQFGLPGMAVFHGPPGLGKTFACLFAARQHDAVHISVQKLWTKKTLLTEILRELSLAPAKTAAEMMKQLTEGLAIADRPLIIDEADYAVDRGMIEIIRDIHDASEVPVILIGMEKLPQKLQKWELVDSRILCWVGAEPVTLRDARMLSDVYAQGLEINDAMLTHVVKINNGNARRICKDLAYLVEICRTEGIEKVTPDRWGNRPLFHTGAPVPRRGIA